MRDLVSAGICMLLMVVVASPGWAAHDPKAGKLNRKEVFKLEEPPSWEALAIQTPDTLVKNWKTHGGQKDRTPAGASLANEDGLSGEYKEIRDKLIKIKNPEDFGKLIGAYNDDAEGPDREDKDFAALPGDAKLLMARLSTMKPFEGIVWRMVPLVHQSLMTQETALTQMRNFAETVAIRFEDSHVTAQALYFSVPSARVSTVRINSEREFTAYLGNEVYRALAKATKRLEALGDMHWTDSKGKKYPITMDTKVRFGEKSFDETYFAPDRFKIQGVAERDAILARYHRRMAVISQIVAYDWDGYIRMMDVVGKEHGIGKEIAKQHLVDYDYVAGMTRAEINRIVRGASYAPLSLLPGGRGQKWMKRAYDHLRANVSYLNSAWENIKDRGDESDFYQLDPEIFLGRKEQVQKGMDNMKELFAVGRAGSIRGALSGDVLRVDLKAFFDNPPATLKDLLPTQFANTHKELMGFYPPNSIKPGKSKGLANINLAGSWVEFRDYGFGRATGWNVSEYKKMFPDLSSPAEVARARRILGESRGVRPIANGILTFVR